MYVKIRFRIVFHHYTISVWACACVPFRSRTLHPTPVVCESCVRTRDEKLTHTDTHTPVHSKGKECRKLCGIRLAAAYLLQLSLQMFVKCEHAIKMIRYDSNVQEELLSDKGILYIVNKHRFL
uniref:Uncharacterized protein n=1 Tax=Anopheles minimus TaxID=112268 RepID=A0A182WPN5_9DIPT